MCTCVHMSGWVRMSHVYVCVCVHVAIWLTLELIFISVVVKDCCKSSPFSCLLVLINAPFLCQKIKTYSTAKQQPRHWSSSLHRPHLFYQQYLNYQLDKVWRVWKLLSTYTNNIIVHYQQNWSITTTLFPPHEKRPPKSLPKKLTEKSVLCLELVTGVTIC